jgi:hypothetical protein
LNFSVQNIKFLGDISKAGQICQTTNSHSGNEQPSRLTSAYDIRSEYWASTFSKHCLESLGCNGAALMKFTIFVTVSTCLNIRNLAQKTTVTCDKIRKWFIVLPQCNKPIFAASHS